MSVRCFRKFDLSINSSFTSIHRHHIVLSIFALCVALLFRQIHSRWIVFNLFFFLHLQAVFLSIIHGHLQSVWDKKQHKMARIVQISSISSYLRVVCSSQSCMSIVSCLQEHNGTDFCSSLIGAPSATQASSPETCTTVRHLRAYDANP